MKRHIRLSLLLGAAILLAAVARMAVRSATSQAMGSGTVWLPLVVNDEPLSQPPVPLAAFPGAQGFGATTPGGRGGAVIQVTNLNDRGPGSLRACLEHSGPRVCVFRVGGTIELESRLEIEDPYVTVAGQTAPGGGITLKSSPSNQRGLVNIKPEAHDVIIRYIRIRPGPGLPPNALDALVISAHHVVIDHVSSSWAVDENMSTHSSDAHHITIQWSILSEGLHNSVHIEAQGHSKGMLLGSENAHSFSIHHNLFAHNDDRHPTITAGNKAVVDVVNNVIYNFGSRVVRISDSSGGPHVNYVANLIQPGPDSWQGVSAPNQYELNYDGSTGDDLQIYVQGNISPNRPDPNYPEDALVRPSSRSQVVPSRHPAPFVTTVSATDAFDWVLQDVGASHGLDERGNFYDRRDAVDKRIIAQIRQGEGKIIDCPSAATLPDCAEKVHLTPADYTRYGIHDPIDAHGWPILEAGTPYADSDQDGMADVWETQHFGTLVQGAATDSSSDFDGDGYTDLEEFLNGTNPVVRE